MIAWHSDTPPPNRNSCLIRTVIFIVVHMNPLFRLRKSHNAIFYATFVLSILPELIILQTNLGCLYQECEQKSEPLEWKKYKKIVTKWALKIFNVTLRLHCSPGSPRVTTTQKNNKKTQEPRSCHISEWNDVNSLCLSSKRGANPWKVTCNQRYIYKPGWGKHAPTVQT